MGSAALFNRMQEAIRCKQKISLEIRNACSIILITKADYFRICQVVYYSNSISTAIDPNLFTHNVLQGLLSKASLKRMR